jgi:selenium metabolism protein YedF
MLIVDTKGQKCPVPIIETRKALKSCLPGESFIVLTDNKTAFSNISKFLNDNKVTFSVIEEKGIWTFNIKNEEDVKITTAPEQYCDNSIPLIKKGDFSVVISSETMGQGDDDLGKKLMTSFFTALSCLDSMPSSVMFYNTGVKLTHDNSPVIDILCEIEKKGVEILICGTCVEHYQIGHMIHVGRISDMFMITQKLSETGNIIRP